LNDLHQSRIAVSIHEWIELALSGVAFSDATKDEKPGEVTFSLNERLLDLNFFYFIRRYILSQQYFYLS